MAAKQPPENVTVLAIWRLPGCGIGAALDVGGVSFLRFVVRGLGDRGCFG